MARGCCAGSGSVHHGRGAAHPRGAARPQGVWGAPRLLPGSPRCSPPSPQSTSSAGLTPMATRRPRRRRTYSYSRCTRECAPGAGLGLLGDLRAPSGHLCDPKRVWGHQCAPLQWKADFGRLTPHFASSWAGQGAPSAQATAGGWMVWGGLCPSLGWGHSGCGLCQAGPPGAKHSATSFLSPAH